MTTLAANAAEVAAQAEYKIYWLRHELVQAEARGDAKEMRRLTKELETLAAGPQQ